MNPHVDSAAVATLEELRRLTVRLGGADRAVTFHPPTYESIVKGLFEQRDRVSRERILVTGELVQLVDLDDVPVLAETAAPIMDSPEALGEILATRERLYRWLLELGRVLAICPACGSHRELDLAFYSAALGLPPWRVTDGDHIAVPALAQPEPPPALLIRPYEERTVRARKRAPRPALPPLAARIDFILPGARAGIAVPGDAVTGTIGDVDHAREIEAWRAWAPPRLEQPRERHHWRADHPGFRAELRLAVAIVELRDEIGALIEPSPEAIEKLFLADVHFLDLVYTATHDLVFETPPPGEEPRCTVHCTCGQAYLPVR